MYKVQETYEAKADVKNLAAYMIYSLKNKKAAIDFLNLYDKQVYNLAIFPLGYRGTDFRYRGYEIRMKTFSSYNIFYILDAREHQITILRILKNRQNWKEILQNVD